MSAHQHGWAYAFIAATTAVAAGLVAVPFLVLPYLPLGWAAKAFGSGMFGCAALTYMWSMTAHPWASRAAVILHLALAACTWGFTLAFRPPARSKHRAGPQTGRRPDSTNIMGAACSLTGPPKPPPQHPPTG